MQKNNTANNFSVLKNRGDSSLIDLYIKCKFIREFELKLLKLFSKGKLSGTTHTSIGQEANAVGIASACNETDIFISNHRCHAHLLAHVGGADLLLKEVMGDSGGFCGGLGGSQHICVPDKFYSNGIQGGIMPLAAGLSLSIKRSAESNRIACVFIGDGTTGEGALYETINLAKCFNLPLLIVIEDNQIAQTTDTKYTISGSIGDRFRAFGLKVSELSYPTAEEVFKVAQKIIPEVRLGGPQAIVIKSCRLGPHSKGDDTRNIKLLEELIKIDPLVRMANELELQGMLEMANAEVIHLIDMLADIENKVIEPADNCLPQYEQLFQKQTDLAELNGKPFIEKINALLEDLLIQNPNSILLGEDIGDPYGGAFKATKGLQEKFPEQVIQMPISELGFTGLAAGAALSGLRPIVEIMFGDFVLLAMDQLVNHAAKYSLMYRNQVSCPLILRLPMGGGRGYGPTHSQSLEKHLCGIPNLQVLAVTPYAPLKPIYELIKITSLPTVIIENKTDYLMKVDFDKDISKNFTVEVFDTHLIYTNKIKESKPDVIIFTYGGQVGIAIDAAIELARKKICVQIFIFIQLSPLPREIFQRITLPLSIKAIFCLEESSTGWGFGSEIAGNLLSFSKLPTSSFIRLGAIESIIPASRTAEKKALPTSDWVSRKISSYFDEIAYEKNLASNSQQKGSVMIESTAIGSICTPQLNANDDKADIVEFLVANGTFVEENQPIVSVETSKAIEDLNSPIAGFILHQFKAGETVNVGEVISFIFNSKDDLEFAQNALNAKSIVEKHPDLSENIQTKSAISHAVETTHIHRGMVKTLEVSHKTIPAAHLIAKFAINNVERKIDPLDHLIFYLSRMHSEFPNTNAFYGSSLHHYKNVNIGFTVDVDGDLYMAVIPNANEKSLEEIVQERKNIILNLYRREVDQNSSAQPTVCVTSLVGKWISHQIPIIYPNTSLIIGLTTQRNPSDSIKITLTASYDHRAISGFEVSKFIDALIDIWIRG